jgi:hypothetical protein
VAVGNGLQGDPQSGGTGGSLGGKSWLDTMKHEGQGMGGTSQDAQKGEWGSKVLEVSVGVLDRQPTTGSTRSR